MLGISQRRDGSGVVGLATERTILATHLSVRRTARGRALATVIVTAVGMLSGGGARADGISFHYLELREVLRSDTRVVEAAILAAQPKRHQLRVSIRRVLKSPKPAPVVGRSYAIGYQKDPEMVPGHWLSVPILWNRLDFEALRKGRTYTFLCRSLTVAGGCVAIPASARTRKKIALLSRPDWQTRYRAGRCRRSRPRDLADFDLVEIAYTCLAGRPKLLHRHVLAHAARIAEFNLYAHHLQHLSPEGQREFLRYVAKRFPEQGNLATFDLLAHAVDALASDPLKRDFFGRLTLALGESKREAAAARQADAFYRYGYDLKRTQDKDVDRDLFTRVWTSLYRKRLAQSLADTALLERVCSLADAPLDERHLVQLAQAYRDRIDQTKEIDDDLLAFIVKHRDGLSPAILEQLLRTTYANYTLDAGSGCSTIQSLTALLLFLADDDNAVRYRKLASELLPHYRCNVVESKKRALERLARPAR
jgi:hypothetical protein